jgi:hypothetical protein
MVEKNEYQICPYTALKEMDCAPTFLWSNQSTIKLYAETLESRELAKKAGNYLEVSEATTRWTKVILTSE